MIYASKGHAIEAIIMLVSEYHETLTNKFYPYLGDYSVFASIVILVLVGILAIILLNAIIAPIRKK